MYWALFVIQNTSKSMQMLCERRTCLNDRTGCKASTGFAGLFTVVKQRTSIAT